MMEVVRGYLLRLTAGAFLSAGLVARSFKLTPQQLADFLKSQQAAPSETVLPQEKEDVHEA
jgi:Na+-translocating ferredoxin:NAD+ oxidoreductase RnfG subunit